MENKTVFCPVLQRQVNGDDCFDISMVAEKTTPDRFLPKDLKPEDFTANITLNKRRSDIPTGVFLCVESDITLSVVSFSYTKTAAPVRRPGGTAKRVEVTINTAEKKGAITHDH